MNPIEYDGQLQLPDIVEAHTLHLRKVPGSGRRRLAGYAVGVLFAVAFIATAPSSATMLVYTGSLFAYVVYTSWRVRRLRRASYQGNATTQSLFRSRIADDGFHTAGELFEDHRRWPAFRRWVEGDRHFLLYEGEHAFRIIPKRLLGDSQVHYLREALTTYLGPAA